MTLKEEGKARVVLMGVSWMKGEFPLVGRVVPPVGKRGLPVDGPCMFPVGIWNGSPGGEPGILPDRFPGRLSTR